MVWWTIRPSLMRLRTSMANMLFSSDCSWFASLMKSIGVSKGTFVINQGERAATRQVVHEVRADQLQRICRRERFAAAAGTLCQNIHRMIEARGSWRQCKSTRSVRARSRRPWPGPAEPHDPSGLAPARARSPWAIGHPVTLVSRQASMPLAWCRPVSRARLARSPPQTAWQFWFQVLPSARFPPSSTPKAAMMAATILSRAMALAPAQIDS